MREYDPSLPLIAIHIPKTGGTSVREIYQNWFGDGLITHYRQESGNVPEKHNLSSMHSKDSPAVVYGHFNNLGNMGIEDYYPEVEQFVTILRDPFERAVSRYFFFGGNPDKPQKDLSDALFSLAPKMSMLCHFPRNITLENYSEIIETEFIEIGVMEHIEESLRRISTKLGKRYEPGSLKRLNVSNKGSNIPYQLKDQFIENHPLEYAVYNYILNRYI